VSGRGGGASFGRGGTTRGVRSAVADLRRGSHRHQRQSQSDSGATEETLVASEPVATCSGR